MNRWHWLRSRVAAMLAAAALYESRANHPGRARQRFGIGLASAPSLLRVAAMKRARRVAALAKVLGPCNVGATEP